MTRVVLEPTDQQPLLLRRCQPNSISPQQRIQRIPPPPPPQQQQQPCHPRHRHRRRRRHSCCRRRRRHIWRLVHPIQPLVWILLVMGLYGMNIWLL